jgi:uncharacterized protein (TIGR00369 family)
VPEWSRASKRTNLAAMADMSEEERLQLWRQLNRRFSEVVPFNKALGLEVIRLERGEAWLRLPYRDNLVGNPATGVMHGGAITALMDAAGGSAAFMALDDATPVATLDLRIDYLKPAVPGRDVVGHASCYKLTRSVAFIRGLAFHAHSDDDPDGGRDDAIASVAATFMIGTPLHRKRAAGEKP